MENNSELIIKHEGSKIELEGALDLYNYTKAKDLLDFPVGATIDLSRVSRLDTAGASILNKAITKRQLKLKNLQKEYQNFLSLINETNLTKSSRTKQLPQWKKSIIALGKSVVDIKTSVMEFVTFLGHTFVELLKVLRHPGEIRFKSIIHQIKTIGVEAIPLICVVAFVISVVIAYQGQVQLKPLGAKQYTINLVAISILREMGVLLTAIMVAGRSGSNFTAEIGVMKVRQEVDALNSMGFNPFSLLVLPRLIALIITLPLLTILADIMGLIGGAIVSTTIMDIPLSEYLERAHSVATLKDFMVGMIKAPVFAFVIALVGTMHGLKVSGSAESVGRETTNSVVKSIFLVLILDGLFSVYFEKVGL